MSVLNRSGSARVFPRISINSINELKPSAAVDVVAAVVCVVRRVIHIQLRVETACGAPTTPTTAVAVGRSGRVCARASRPKTTVLFANTQRACAFIYTSGNALLWLWVHARASRNIVIYMNEIARRTVVADTRRAYAMLCN